MDMEGPEARRAAILPAIVRMRGGVGTIDVLSGSVSWSPLPFRYDRSRTPEGFEHGYEMANGGRYHYVRGGKGEAVILLHGWPTTWYLWHKMMFDLAEAGYDVSAVDSAGGAPPA